MFVICMVIGLVSRNTELLVRCRVAVTNAVLCVQ